MSEDYVLTKVLITVMTYPHPSVRYDELICTAGITESKEWVRLYPIDHRYRPAEQQFHKYQWIEVELRPRGDGNDNRRESRCPRLESIRTLGPRLSTKDCWAERRLIVDGMPHYTCDQLKSMYVSDKVSLGIVRPVKIHDLKIEPADADWKPEWKSRYAQLRLFGPPPKPLRKIPYKFSYVFDCEDSAGKSHTAMCEDWEMGVLFLKECSRLGSDQEAADSVKRKFFGEMCRADKDTRFFMGTVFPYNSWVVVGVFWPGKEDAKANLAGM